MKSLSMNPRSKKVIIICDNIRSLYNVGSIFRTSDGSGVVTKIYLTGMTGYPKPDDPTWTQTQKIAKTSLGAEKYIDWEYVKDPTKLVQNLKKQKFNIYCLENNIGSDCENYSKQKYLFPMALILGHEVKGIKPEILSLCDKCVFIPMRGRKESLNVASAYAIAIYEISKHIFQ